MNLKKQTFSSFLPFLFNIGIIIGLIMIITSCNANDEQEAAMPSNDTIAEVKKEEVKFLYPSTYASDWKIGDPQKIVLVQELYKVMLADSNYESMLPYLADSVTNVMWDNRTTRLSAKDFTELVKNFRKRYLILHEEFRNYVSLRSDMQNKDMVMLWIKEKGTHQNGKVDSSGYQETWRFNDQGKIEYRSTYVRYDF